MGEIRCKTWENRDPGGLIAIFFCAPQEDHDLYFEEITDAILKLRKTAAVYYAEEIEDVTDELLSRMRLLVVPVTMAFLHPACRERLEIFERARSLHIPMLPVLKQKGISRFFSELCGKIQVLDGTGTDHTGIPFETKLEQFLDSVFVGDETVKRIREAFDAYIFLSYRKKDRKHAEKIMHLIHENPFMRDVAIWYDEYLVPGEAYSEAIENALIKSRLVALLVTPNLVNEDNYVKRVEYPMARERGKKVLPIEAEATDSALFREQYAGAGDICDADDHEAVSEILSQVFLSEGFKENDDPEHLYFIGMAYLLGIDVEVDRERAGQLLMRSAEGGCDEAAAFIVDCFREGRYVRADFEMARDWQQFRISRFVEKLQAITNEEGELEWSRVPSVDPRGMYAYYTDLLDAYADILVVCEGYSEEALATVRAMVKTMEERAEEPASDKGAMSPEQLKAHDEIMISMAREKLVQFLSHYPGEEAEREISEQIEKIFDICRETFRTMGFYSPTWDVCRIVHELSGVILTQPSLFGCYIYAQKIFAEVHMEQCYSDCSDEDQLNILYYSMLLKYDLMDHVMNVPCDDETERREAIREFCAPYAHGPGEMLAEDERQMEDICLLLTDADREEDREQFRQRFFRSYGVFCLYLGDDMLPEAERLLWKAVNELKDREDLPDVMMEQVINLKNILRIGHRKKDRKLLEETHWEIDDLYDRIYFASGNMAAWEKEATENWEQMRVLGFVGNK
ncbi:MAG: toll/interleukin-1 receptor domain-containing protein [Lachnospiraceae bacterium]|nr:toll/interleukin-1 receptor domain-containing protein [Lachnospiraceae bacterium]